MNYLSCTYLGLGKVYLFSLPIAWLLKGKTVQRVYEGFFLKNASFKREMETETYNDILHQYFYSKP